MSFFLARVYKIGVNPYVLIPQVVLKEIFLKANKDRGPIPVRGELNGFVFTQTLVKFSGKWRLYLNTPMRKGAAVDVGDRVGVKIEFDARVRQTKMPVQLQAALNKNKKANAVFSKLAPSRQKEIMRYIGNLKSEEAIDKNVKKAIRFLTGKERFVGRDKP